MHSSLDSYGYTCKECLCKNCKCNYTNILFMQSVLIPGAVPNDKHVKSAATGLGTIVMTNDFQFYISIYIHQKLENIIMAHVHLKNTEHPTSQNGPIILWLTNSMHKPISIQNGFLVSKTFTWHDFIGPLQNTDFETFLTFVKKEMLYFNIHTVKYPNGEIAGNVSLLHEWK